MKKETKERKNEKNNDKMKYILIFFLKKINKILKGNYYFNIFLYIILFIKTFKVLTK